MAESIIRNCEHCGKPFKAYAYSIKLGFGRFHSKPCHDAFRVAHMAERFWKKVDKAPGHGPWGDCWIWTAGVFNDGYGAFCRGKQNLHASRVAYELIHGFLPSRKILVRHTCDNTLCVNPAHLIAGTPKQNSQDAVERGRLEKGENRYNAKLTDEAVRIARTEYSTGQTTKHALAQRLGVSDSTIHKAIIGEGWKHVV